MAKPRALPEDTNKQLRDLFEQLLSLPEADPAREKATERFRLYKKFTERNAVMADKHGGYSKGELLAFFEIDENGGDRS